MIATFAASLLTFAGVPLGAIYLATNVNAVLGVAAGLAGLVGGASLTRRLAPDGFVLEIAILTGFLAGLGLVAYFSLR